MCLRKSHRHLMRTQQWGTRWERVRERERERVVFKVSCWWCVGLPIKQNEEQNITIRDKGWKDELFQGWKLWTGDGSVVHTCRSANSGLRSGTRGHVKYHVFCCGGKQTDRLEATGLCCYVVYPAFLLYSPCLHVITPMFPSLRFFFSYCSSPSPQSFIRHSAFCYLYRKLLKWRCLTN